MSTKFESKCFLLPPPISEEHTDSFQKLCLFDGGGKIEIPEQTLYRGQGKDLMRAVGWLAQAPDNFLIKITGGCLKMSPEDAAGLYEIFVEAFGTAESDYEGALLGGGTVSVLSENPLVKRPSMPEIVPLLERLYTKIHALGVVPAATSSELESGGLLITKDIHEGKEWDIKLDPYQSRALLVEERTPYLWNAEAHAAFKLTQMVDMMRPLRGSLLISYDGGEGTRNEIEGWLNMNTRQAIPPKVILMVGSDIHRTTDSLAHNEVWRRKYGDRVHLVEKSADALKSKLTELGAFQGMPSVSGNGQVTSKVA